VPNILLQSIKNTAWGSLSQFFRPCCTFRT